MRSDHGFTTLELLVAASLLLLVVAAAVDISRTAPEYFAAQNEATDQHQRLRVAADTLFADLLAADAVRPYRSGGSSPDPPGTVKSDTITALGPGVHTYWLKRDDANAVYQLMSYAGGISFDVPVVDHVVLLAFTYEGDPQPPTVVRPLDDPQGPWTSYGPAPPLAAVPPFGPRENCAFVDNGTTIPDPRLGILSGGSGPVPLTAAQLTDGPWCPDDGAAERWDADLLRVRSIGVSLRVQAALASLRGPAGQLFLHAGTASAASRWAPDISIRFRVSPRNLQRGS
jgi:hypothetical protein